MDWKDLDLVHIPRTKANVCHLRTIETKRDLEGVSGPRAVWPQTLFYQ